MIIGLISDFFLPQCKPKRSFIYTPGWYVWFKVFFIYIIKIIFEDSRTGKILTPIDLIKFGLLS